MTATEYTATEVARALQAVGVSAEPRTHEWGEEVYIYGHGFTGNQGLIRRFPMSDYDGDSNGANGAARRILLELAKDFLNA